MFMRSTYPDYTPKNQGRKGKAIYAPQANQAAKPRRQRTGQLYILIGAMSEKAPTGNRFFCVFTARRGIQKTAHKAKNIQLLAAFTPKLHHSTIK
jgi:hypothetical protein